MKDGWAAVKRPGSNGVQCLAQGHFNMRLMGRAGIEPATLWLLDIPHELQPTPTPSYQYIDHKTNQVQWPKPFLGFHEDGRHLGVRVQDLIDLYLCFMIDAILVPRISEATRRVIHSREVVVALPLGTQTDLITMVLDLWLVPQRYLDLRRQLPHQMPSFITQQLNQL